MTQKDKIREAIMFATRVKSISSSIKSEGDDYDMSWHKKYCIQLTNAADELFRKLK